MEFWAPLHVSPVVGNATILHAETGALVRCPLKLDRSTLVAMMQAAHLRQGDNLARSERLD